jgi:hypothetical protein
MAHFNVITGLKISRLRLGQGELRISGTVQQREVVDQGALLTSDHGVGSEASRLKAERPLLYVLVSNGPPSSEQPLSTF